MELSKNEDGLSIKLDSQIEREAVIIASEAFREYGTNVLDSTRKLRKPLRVLTNQLLRSADSAPTQLSRPLPLSVQETALSLRALDYATSHDSPIFITGQHIDCMNKMLKAISLYDEATATKKPPVRFHTTENH